MGFLNFSTFLSAQYRIKIDKVLVYPKEECIFFNGQTCHLRGVSRSLIGVGNSVELYLLMGRLMHIAEVSS